MSNPGNKELRIPGSGDHCLKSVWFVCDRTGIWAVAGQESEGLDQEFCKQGLVMVDFLYFSVSRGWHKDSCRC